MARSRSKNNNDDLPPPIAKFTCGDTVQLHSGGPPLTVVDAQAGLYLVRVAWFDQALALQNSVLPQDCLKLVQSVPSAQALGAEIAEATEKPAGYVDIIGQVGT